MPDKQEGKKDSQRKPGEDAKIEDLEKRQDKVADEKDVTGGAAKKNIPTQR
ncbi:MAG: hypothetical protein M3477_07025 [Gemmatimonadota bacterium]|nr:hypothetical protein [Gemmatimonadota bacterium]